MGLGTNNMTVTTGAKFIPELWAPLVVAATEANLVLWNKVWDWSEDEPGNKVQAPTITNLATNTKVAGSEVTLNAPLETDHEIDVTTHKECSFLIEDILKAQSKYNITKYYTDKAGYAVAKTMDSAVSALFASFSQIVGGAETNIGDQQIRDAIEYLDLADSPEIDRCLVIHPSQKNALFGIEKYFRADFTGGSSSILNKGKFGEIYGVPVFVTTNLGTSGNARLNAMFHKESIATAVSYGPRTQGDYILEYLAHLIVSDVVFGLSEIRDDFGVWVKS